MAFFLPDRFVLRKCERLHNVTAFGKLSQLRAVKVRHRERAPHALLRLRLSIPQGGGGKVLLSMHQNNYTEPKHARRQEWGTQRRPPHPATPLTPSSACKAVRRAPDRSSLFPPLKRNLRLSIPQGGGGKVLLSMHQNNYTEPKHARRFLFRLRSCERLHNVTAFGKLSQLRAVKVRHRESYAPEQLHGTKARTQARVGEEGREQTGPVRSSSDDPRRLPPPRQAFDLNPWLGRPAPNGGHRIRQRL
jgi:hypothetical protein